MRKELFIYFLMSLTLVSCSNENNYKTNEGALKNIIKFPIKPTSIKYELLNKKLGKGSQDCSEIIYLIIESKYSSSNFDSLKNIIESEKSYNYPVPMKRWFYKKWFSQSIKDNIEKQGDFYLMKPKVYSGNSLFFNENIFGRYFAILGNENRLLLKIEICTRN